MLAGLGDLKEPSAERVTRHDRERFHHRSAMYRPQERCTGSPRAKPRQNAGHIHLSTFRADRLELADAPEEAPALLRGSIRVDGGALRALRC